MSHVALGSVTYRFPVSWLYQCISGPLGGCVSYPSRSEAEHDGRKWEPREENREEKGYRRRGEEEEEGVRKVRKKGRRKKN